MKEMRKIFCPHCGHSFIFDVSTEGKTGGGLAGAVAGATIGAKIGIVGGPIGAMAGTIPGAILGWFGGGRLGKSMVDDPKMPKLHENI